MGFRHLGILVICLSGCAGAGGLLGDGGGTTGATGTSGAGACGGSCSSCDLTNPSCPSGQTCVPVRDSTDGGPVPGFCATPCSASTNWACSTAQNTCVDIGGNGYCYPWGCLGLGQTPDSSGIAREPWPQLQYNGGDIIANPHLVVITFANATYNTGITGSALSTFAQEMISTNYLQSVTAEYGIQSYTFDGAVAVTDTPPSSITDTGVQSYIQGLISAGTVPAPVSDGMAGSSLYIIYYPMSSTVYEDQAMTAASCQAFLGYHGPASAPTTQLGFTYAVIADCGADGLYGPNGTALNALQSIETATSHEITEAVTDPGPTANNVGWAMTTMAVNDSAWQGLEVADMCIGIYADLGGNGDMVQRIWSNQAASQGGSPCNPQPPNGVTSLFGIPYQIVASSGSSVQFPLRSFSTQGTNQVSYSAVGGQNFVNAFGSNGGVGSAAVGSCITLSMTVPTGQMSGSAPFSNCSVASNDANSAIESFWSIDVLVQ